MKRIDAFNNMVGLIFAQLYENFPIPIQVNQKLIAEGMGVYSTQKDLDWNEVHEFGDLDTGDNFYTLFDAALVWLRGEEFIRGDGDTLVHADVILTSKALAVMNATPAGLDRSLGAKLSDAVKEGGSEVGRSVIADLTGQIIGRFTKNWFG